MYYLCWTRSILIVIVYNSMACVLDFSRKVNGNVASERILAWPFTVTITVFGSKLVCTETIIYFLFDSYVTYIMFQIVFVLSSLYSFLNTKTVLYILVACGVSFWHFKLNWSETLTWKYNNYNRTFYLSFNSLQNYNPLQTSNNSKKLLLKFFMI